MSSPLASTDAFKRDANLIPIYIILLCLPVVLIVVFLNTMLGGHFRHMRSNRGDAGYVAPGVWFSWLWSLDEDELTEHWLRLRLREREHNAPRFPENIYQVVPRDGTRPRAYTAVSAPTQTEDQGLLHRTTSGDAMSTAGTQTEYHEMRRLSNASVFSIEVQVEDYEQRSRSNSPVAEGVNMGIQTEEHGQCSRCSRTSETHGTAINMGTQTVEFDVLLLETEEKKTEEKPELKPKEVVCHFEW